MDRREFLRSTGGLAALATGGTITTGAATAADSSTVAAAGCSVSFACPWRAHHAGFADDAYRLARRMEAALGDTIVLEFRNGSSNSDVAVTLAQSEISHHPAFAYFGGLPGHDALAARELDAWLARGGGQHLWDDLAAAHDFKPLLVGHTGADPVLWSRTSVSAPQDLEGRHVIVRGLDADIVRALGAIPIPGDETTLENALDDPATDAVVWGSLVHASSAGVPARFPHGLSGAFGSAGGALALKINLALWDSLSVAEKTAVEGVAQSEFRSATADAEATRAAVSHAIEIHYGAIIKSPSVEFTSAVSRIAAAVVAHTAAYDATAARVDRSYAAFRRALRGSTVNIA